MSPLFAANPPPPTPKVIPRLAFNVTVAAFNKSAPPFFKVIQEVFAEPGAVLNEVSAMIDTIPLFTIKLPRLLV